MAMKERFLTIDEMQERWEPSGLLEAVSEPLKAALVIALNSQTILMHIEQNDVWDARDTREFNRLSWPSLVRAFVKIEQTNLPGIPRNLEGHLLGSSGEILDWDTDIPEPKYPEGVPFTLDRETLLAEEFGNEVFAQIKQLCEHHNGMDLLIRGMSINDRERVVIHYSF